MGVDPAFQDRTRVCFYNIWRIDVDVETQDKGSVGCLEFAWGRAAPGHELLGPWRAWRWISAGQMALDGPVGDRRSRVGQIVYGGVAVVAVPALLQRCRRLGMAVALGVGVEGHGGLWERSGHGGLPSLAWTLPLVQSSPFHRAGASSVSSVQPSSRSANG